MISLNEVATSKEAIEVNKVNLATHLTFMKNKGKKSYQMTLMVIFGALIFYMTIKYQLILTNHFNLFPKIMVIDNYLRLLTNHDKDIMINNHISLTYLMFRVSKNDRLTPDCSGTFLRLQNAHEMHIHV